MIYSVYVFLDSRNRPYYVGKTSNMVRRRKEHVQEILGGNSLPKYTKARKLIQMGQKFKMTRIRTAKTEDEAYRLERHYIKKYRRMGYVLMNCTYGGPDEIPMKINNMKNPNQKGILLPAKKKPKKVVVKKKKKKQITIKKKTKKVTKTRRRR
jgi:predicted GIY-YIG superfamily endonuclease